MSGKNKKRKAAAEEEEDEKEPVAKRVKHNNDDEEEEEEDKMLSTGEKRAINSMSSTTWNSLTNVPNTVDEADELRKAYLGVFNDPDVPNPITSIKETIGSRVIKKVADMLSISSAPTTNAAADGYQVYDVAADKLHEFKGTEVVTIGREDGVDVKVRWICSRVNAILFPFKDVNKICVVDPGSLAGFTTQDRVDRSGKAG